MTNDRLLDLYVATARKELDAAEQGRQDPEASFMATLLQEELEERGLLVPGELIRRGLM